MSGARPNQPYKLWHEKTSKEQQADLDRFAGHVHKRETSIANPKFHYLPAKAGPVVYGKSRPCKKPVKKSEPEPREGKIEEAESKTSAARPPQAPTYLVQECQRNGCTKECFARMKTYNGDPRKICRRRFLEWFDPTIYHTDDEDDAEVEDELANDSDKEYDSLYPDLDAFIE